MADKVLVVKCGKCATINAAALIDQSANPRVIGKMAVAAIIEVVYGPVQVSACRCERQPIGQEFLALRDKVETLETQVSNERYRRKSAEEGSASERVKNLVRMATITGETLTVDQLRDAIEGPTRPLGVAW